MKNIEQTNNFIPRVQSMRGIAALIVVLGHIYITFPNGLMNHQGYELHLSSFPLSVGYVIFQANSAVIFFYVLSGFILGGSFRRGTSLPLMINWLSFAIRRATRLLPVMWLSILFAVVCLSQMKGAQLESVTSWFNDPFRGNVQSEMIFQNFFAYDTSINPLMWSIQVELVMVGILPIMALIIMRTSLLVDAVIYSGLCAVSVIFWAAIPNPFIYSYCFYLGLMLPKILEIPAFTRCLSSVPTVIFCVLTYLLTGFLVNSNLFWMPYKFLIDAPTSAVLLIFVLRSMGKPGLAALDWPLVRTLGDISYSFYAYGLMIQLITGYFLISSLGDVPRISNVQANFIVISLILICVPINFGLSLLSYRYIELPIISVGRTWARKMENWYVQSARDGHEDETLAE